ncbi:MAG: hypothetical protein EA377_10600 [Phycisphaerales bacterium]|nr:MAG: hypothetical protein EA377_10600 [Phycisphaerales bacterium]
MATKKKKRTTKKKKTGRRKKTTAKRTAKRGPARKKKKKTTRKKRGTRALSSLSTSELQAELERREAQRGELERERDALLAQVASIEDELNTLGGTPRRRGPGRPRKVGTAPRAVSRGRRRGRRARNSMNLVEALKKTLAGRTMSVTDVTEQVQKEGYQTTSANFRTIVNQALLSNPGDFKKVSRGQYTAK